MKTGIHPQYQPTIITCTCGNTFTTRSTETSGNINVEVCSNCHPFYTGKQKILDTGGRVARFQARYAKMEKKAAGAKKAADTAAPATEAAAAAPEKQEDNVSETAKRGRVESTPGGKVDVDDAPIDAIETEISDQPSED